MPRYLSQEEISLLMQNSSQYFIQILIISLLTGLRSSELLNLRWEHVDFSSGQINIRNTDLFKTKNMRDRSISINSVLNNYLSYYKENYIDPVTDNAHKREPWQMDYVICHQDGRPLKSIKTTFNKQMAKCGIKGVTPHTLRHTFASIGYMAGISIHTLQSFMGHQDMRTTQGYTQVHNDYEREQMERFTPFFKQACGAVTNVLPNRKVA